VNFPFEFAVEFNWFGWRGEDAVDVITLPGREFVDMEDGVDSAEGMGKAKFIVEVADAFGYFIWSKLKVGQLASGDFDGDVF
jgi:hypothetical protein